MVTSDPKNISNNTLNFFCKCGLIWSNCRKIVLVKWKLKAAVVVGNLRVGIITVHSWSLIASMRSKLEVCLNVKFLIAVNFLAWLLTH